MKLAVISYFFPPCSTGAGTVNYNMFKYIAQTEYEVITVSDSTWFKLGTYDLNYVFNVNAHKLPVYSTSNLNRLIFTFLSLIIGLRLLMTKKVDNILVIYPYFCDLISGYLLHKITGKPLLIYMHDLFSETRKQAHLYKVWNKLEWRIMSSAKVIFVMNNKYISHYSSKGINNMVLLPPTIDLSEIYYFDLDKINESEKTNDLKIVFTGSAYGANENAILKFLESTERLDSLKVVFATPSLLGQSEKLQSKLKKVSIGFLDKKQCINLQKSADVLLLPLAFNSVYPDEIRCAFPCKLLEYMAVGKPILALVPKGTFVEYFINKYKVGIAVTELNENRIIEAIELLRDVETNRKLGENAKNTVKLFDSKKQSQEFISLLNQIN
ncbi:MAG: glycosyltransferase family 4 protein [Candidatus Bathyarchaeota archaeon]|nr:glycosyltransferase family 4 protein [Candidatus Bathyarchaeota archaeon]